LVDIPNAAFLYPQNSYDLRADYGPSDFDARQRFVLSGFYAFPTTGNRAISGWEMALIQTAQSGNPLQPIFVSSTSAIFPGVNLRPNISGWLGVTGSPVQWFSDPGAFASPCTHCRFGDHLLSGRHGTELGHRS
jgi:hypothetical protein